MRFAKRIVIEGVKVQVLFELFNVFNRQNPAAVERLPNITGQPFGQATQVLPGREGQFGFGSSSDPMSQAEGGRCCRINFVLHNYTDYKTVNRTF